MPTYREYIRKARAGYVRTLVQAAAGNITEAARLAGLHRTSLHKLMVQTGVAPKTVRGNDAWRALS